MRAAEWLRIALWVLAFWASAPDAMAQEVEITFGGDGSLALRSIQLISLLTVLSLAPSILVMVTSFTRIVVVLSFLRNAVRELGQTVVMVTHDPVAASYADRIVFLADGRIVDEMSTPTPEQVLDRMKRFGR